MKTKTKITVAVVSVLSVVALAGTGYAGWVISQDASKDASGNVVVYNVKDNGVDMGDISFTGGKKDIVWGTAKKTTSNDWFTAEAEQTTEGKSEEMKAEFFTPEVSFIVTNKDGKDETTPNVVANLVVTDNSANAYTTCITNELIKGPEAGAEQKFAATGNLQQEITKVDGKKNEFSVSLKINAGFFGWGDHFKVGETNVNPINFYNAHLSTDKVSVKENAITYFEDAKNSMGQIFTLDGVTFKISITVSHGGTK